MNLLDHKHIYFLGIGGIGMSGLARYCATKGITISGYDKTVTPLTKQLEKEGMQVCYDESLDHLSEDISLVIYTPAVPTSHAHYQYFLDKGTAMIKRAAGLGLVADAGKTIAIAGTHGKTTTSSMTAHTLKHAGLDISAFLGGIVIGYDTNYIIGNDPYIVVEADEYDRSFLALHPYIAAVNAVDADHLDIYGSQAAFYDSFIQFLNQCIEGAHILIKEEAAEDLGESALDPLKEKFTVETFGFGLTCDWQIIPTIQGRFDVFGRDHNILDLSVCLPGAHNMANASVAAIIAHKLGLSNKAIVESLASFKGVKRRFETIAINKGKTYIDDYAHHPKELKSAHQAVRASFPNQKVLAIFQPHLFTRTRDFMQEFADALGQFDEVLLLDIYPARELPIEGITSKALAELIGKTCKVVSKEEVLDFVEKGTFDVVLTLGAGDIDTLIPSIKSIINDN